MLHWVEPRHLDIVLDLQKPEVQDLVSEGRQGTCTNKSFILGREVEGVGRGRVGGGQRERGRGTEGGGQRERELEGGRQRKRQRKGERKEGGWRKGEREREGREEGRDGKRVGMNFY